MSIKQTSDFNPGHSPNSFAPTTTLLTKAGYDVHGVHLPSYGANPPLKSFDPDVLAVKDVVNKVLSTGKDVVMIFHSYGGVVGCEALKEYVNEHETGKSGKQGWGRIRRLVFVAAFVLPEGGSLMAGLGFKPLPWFDIDVSSSFIVQAYLKQKGAKMSSPDERRSDWRFLTPPGRCCQSRQPKRDLL